MKRTRPSYCSKFWEGGGGKFGGGTEYVLTKATRPKTKPEIPKKSVSKRVAI